MTEYLVNQVKHLKAPLQNAFSQGETLRLPDIKQTILKLPIVSSIFRVVVLISNIPMMAVLCWNIITSFFKMNPIDLITTSFGSPSVMGALTSLPDIDDEWIRWPVLIITLIFVVADLLTSVFYLIAYLKTQVESCLKRSFGNFLSVSTIHSPSYGLFIALQSLWLQQLSLISASLNAHGSIVSFSSVKEGFQTVTILLTFVLSIWLRIAESGLCCCIGKSSNEGFKTVLKCINTLLQLGNFVISLIILIENVKGMTFDFSGTDWFFMIASPVWVFMKIIKYIVNIFGQKQEQERGKEVVDLKEIFETEMTDFGNRNQQRGGRNEGDGYYYQAPSEDSHKAENGGQGLRGSNWRHLSKVHNF